MSSESERILSSSSSISGIGGVLGNVITGKVIIRKVTIKKVITGKVITGNDNEEGCDRLNNRKTSEKVRTQGRSRITRIGGALATMCIFVAAGVFGIGSAFGIGGSASFAEIAWYDSGVIGEKLIGGEHEYTEMTFVTGEPVKLRGTVKKDPAQSVLTAKGNGFKQTYRYNLVSDDGNIAVDRQIAFDVKFVRNPQLNQIKVERKLSKFNETFVTPLGTFVLGKYSYTDSRIVDVRTAVAYTSGNAVLERTYYLNGNHLKNAGVLTVKSEIRPFIAYENRYSGNESVKVIHQYDFKPSAEGGKGSGTETDSSSVEDKKDRGFGGSVETNLSSLEKTIFDYQHTDPQNISFRGSFFAYRTQENVLEARYDFYREGKRIGSNERLHSKATLSSEPLTIPLIRDMGGHPAERQVALLMAMGILDPNRTYFVPYAGISRHEFAKAVYIALKGELPTPDRTDIIKRQRNPEHVLFYDVPADHPDYHYIEAYKDASLVKGKGGYLKPNDLITKAEALSILLRTIGLDRVAPASPYKTIFVDDGKIAEWCRDSFYMALEIGLIGGEDTDSITVRTEEGIYAGANEYLKKEQAAVLIERLIRHLNETLIQDYREKILKN